MQGFPALVRAQDGQPVRFLVVDDSIFARKNLQRILAMFGGQVAGEAADGRAAIVKNEIDKTNCNFPGFSHKPALCTEYLAKAE